MTRPNARSLPIKAVTAVTVLVALALFTMTVLWTVASRQQLIEQRAQTAETLAGTLLRTSQAALEARDIVTLERRTALYAADREVAFVAFLEDGSILASFVRDSEAFAAWRAGSDGIGSDGTFTPHTGEYLPPQGGV